MSQKYVLFYEITTLANVLVKLSGNVKSIHRVKRLRNLLLWLMIDGFGLVEWKRLDNVYKMSQNIYYFENEITTFVQCFGKTAVQHLAYWSCGTSLQRFTLIRDWPFLLGLDNVYKMSQIRTVLSTQLRRLYNISVKLLYNVERRGHVKRLCNILLRSTTVLTWLQREKRLGNL